MADKAAILGGNFLQRNYSFGEVAFFATLFNSS